MGSLAVNYEAGLVSIVIPAYNRVDYIDEAIDSVFAQRYPLKEVIVIDDGSNDGTYEKLRKYEQNGKLILLTHENRANKGQSASINLGIAHSRGEYVAILDSDDLFADEKLTKQVGFLENNPQVGMVYGPGMAIDENGNQLFKTLPDNHQEQSDPDSILLDCYMAIPGGSLIRRSVFERAGLFEEGFRASQDHDMAIRIFEITKVAFVNEIAFFYRKHEDSISNKSLERRWNAGFKILSNAVERYPYKKSTLRKRLAVLHYRMAGVRKMQGRHLSSLIHFVKSGFYDPVRTLAVLLNIDKSK